MKREEPAIQVDCVVREKKITLEPKDRLELYHSMFCCFEDQQLWHCLGPCFKGCVLGSTQKCHMWGWGPSILNIDTRFQVRPGEGVWL